MNASRTFGAGTTPRSEALDGARRLIGRRVGAIVPGDVIDVLTKMDFSRHHISSLYEERGPKRRAQRVIPKGRPEWQRGPLMDHPMH